MKKLFKYAIAYLLSTMLLVTHIHADDTNPAQSTRLYGKILETIDAGNYTYVHIVADKKEYWAAGPKTLLKKGDMVAFNTGMPFKNFHSKALKRDFEVIYFVNKIITDKSESATKHATPHSGGIPSPHAGMKTQQQKITGIKKALNGKTITEIFLQKQKLAGKNVSVRGKVVKYSPNILGKNWLHIQDGSDARNLAVTTMSKAKKGDVVLVSGKVRLDQNIGHGYVYEILLEDARVKIE